MIQVDLKHCINEALQARKISQSQASELNNFVNSLTEHPYYEISYFDFDKSNSQGLSFKDATREASFSISNPVVVGNVDEEKKFDVTDVLSATYTKLENLKVYNNSKTIQYNETTDYTVDTETGVISRVLTGLITAEQIVHLEYYSHEPITVDTAVLQTNAFKLGKTTLKAIKIDADNENIVFQLSKNGGEFYTISTYNIFEQFLISDEIKLRVVTTSPNIIRRIMLIVNKSLT